MDPNQGNWMGYPPQNQNYPSSNQGLPLPGTYPQQGGYNQYPPPQQQQQSYPPQQMMYPPQQGYQQGYPQAQPQYGYAPQIPQQIPPQIPPEQYQVMSAVPAQGKKKGLFIGINYFGSPHELKGPIEDVKSMVSTLGNYGFQNNLILTDNNPDPNLIPTRNNMMAGIKWLVQGAQAGDSLFFHYSGHGSQKVDTDGDEADGMDETILPVDFKTAGQITDDELWTQLVQLVPAGCKLTSLMDCCHSGTGMDLPFSFEAERGFSLGSSMITHGNKKNKKEKKMKKPKKEKKEKKSKGIGGNLVQGGMKMCQGDVVLFSGCMDHQTAADVSTGYSAGGAMTMAFIKALGPNQTYAQLILRMRDILAGKYTQIPQLSSGRPMDLNQPFVL